MLSGIHRGDALSRVLGEVSHYANLEFYLYGHESERVVRMWWCIKVNNLLTKEAASARDWVLRRSGGRDAVASTVGNAIEKNSSPSWTDMTLTRASTLSEVYSAIFFSRTLSAVPSRFEEPAPIASRILLAVSALAKQGVNIELPRVYPAVGKVNAASNAADRHVPMTS